MAQLEILKLNHPILRQKAKPVKKVTKETLKLLDNMEETMRAADGVGLAAPQVGVLRRIVVIDIGDGLVELINPEILDAKGSETDMEGCLSIPGVAGEVTRAQQVTVQGINRLGKQVEITANGLKARALQHEIDHLEGILFIDKARNIQENTEGERE